MSWNKEIRAARNCQELLTVAKDFVAKLSPREIATLPAGCREIRVKGIDDLYFWHERLAEEFFALAAKDDPSDAHRTLLDFFTVASERAAELGEAPSDHEPANKDVLPAESTVRGGKRVLH